MTTRGEAWQAGALAVKRRRTRSASAYVAIDDLRNKTSKVAPLTGDRTLADVTGQGPSTAKGPATTFLDIMRQNATEVSHAKGT